MLNFLNSYSKVFDIKTFRNKEKFIKEFQEIYCQKLNDSYIKTIKTTKDSVSFKGTICRYTWNGWNLFNPISSGEIKFSEANGKTQIKLNFKYTEFFVIALLMSLLSAVAYFSGLTGWAIGIFLADWLLFYIGSRIISSFRITSFISTSLQEVDNVDTKKHDPDSYLKEEWNFFERVFLRRERAEA